MTSPQPGATRSQHHPAIASLSPAEQARGRRLVLASHPFHMTFRRLFMEDLPTLALVSLGAGDAAVGLQRAFDPLSALLQLPTLRALVWTSKRTLLLAGQGIALLGAPPLLCFPVLAGFGSELGTLLALAAVAFAVCWIPLRGFGRGLPHEVR